MRAMGWAFARASRMRLAQRVARQLQRPLIKSGMIRRLPPPFSAWTRTRDLRPVAKIGFVEQATAEDERPA
jgi:hypothetical protein